MALNRKLSLLSLSKEEQVKAENKFLASLALVDEDEIKDIVDYLNTQGVSITKARELKVVANSKEELAKKFSILSELHETNIYIQDPSQLNRNVIDIYKKIKYCMQIGKSYVREDGTYEPFLFSEVAWQKEMSKEVKQEVVEPTKQAPIEDFITLEPVSEPVLEIIEPAIPQVEEQPIDDTDHIDIKEYMKATEDAAELEAKTTSFADIKKSLEDQLALLDSFKTAGLEEEISFNDLEPESYGMGRAA